MELGLLVMMIIIAITVIVMGAVMYYGLKHDPHTDIRSPESSRAVQILQGMNEAASRKLAEKSSSEKLATETAGNTAKTGASALGSDEEKAARKAAALARKAARQQTTEG